ncbi:PEP-CTERM sorting domain-containing protein [Sphaerotilus sp.]|uniref:PEP-CTERM sorting domain-containing protein n=1 Tax=Sphaerotilus sp. TaxID=2093942 RepID=UPI002ACD9E2B|nr:PEP-CTERM sorting domain-containing protein [Sphaerotilus sp.]MDZ7856412.1 PEP-CTERM sorting domain-containing protein [Sphaerotilus sp.]
MHTSIRKTAAAAALMFVAFGSQAQTIPLVDAGFDAPTLGYPASWSIGSGTPTLVAGQLDLDMDESVYQSFSVLSAALYTISFDVIGEGRSRLFLSSSVPSFGSINPDTLVVATSGSSLNAVTDWGPTMTNTSYTFQGLAGESYHLYFSGKGLNGMVVDNVSIMAAPVPEPESYAMMLAGLGALGFMARRRKQSQG